MELSRARARSSRLRIFSAGCGVSAPARGECPGLSSEGTAIESKDPEPETSKERRRKREKTSSSSREPPEPFAPRRWALYTGSFAPIELAAWSREEGVLLLLADPPRLKVKGAPRDTPPRASPRGGGRREGGHGANTLGGNPRGEARVTPRDALDEKRAAPAGSARAASPRSAIPRVPRSRPRRKARRARDAREGERASREKHVVLPLTNPPRPGVDLCRRRARRSGRARRGGDVGKISETCGSGKLMILTRQDLGGRFSGWKRCYPEFTHANSYADKVTFSKD